VSYKIEKKVNVHTPGSAAGGKRKVDEVEQLLPLKSTEPYCDVGGGV
jgi:hypothetical protein